MFSFNACTVFLDHRADLVFDLFKPIISFYSTLIRTSIKINFRITAREISHFSVDLASVSILFAPYESCYLLLPLNIDMFNFISFIGLYPFIRLTCLLCLTWNEWADTSGAT